MTINKSQGDTLIKVRIYLPQSVFIHGKLYVSMSRVKSYNGLQFALASPSENSMAMTSCTNNVFFKSALILYWWVQLFSVDITSTPTWVLI